MGFGDDEEILQDFLVEAGEILENLSEQLVELERRPDDRDLLNAIFRGFHTVKGGAGFLQLTPMVECCHVTENLFDILRNGQRQVTSELMDVVLQALDTVNQQFSQLQQHEEVTPATPELLQALGDLVNGESLSALGSADVAPVSDTVRPTADKIRAGSDITDAEFDSLLDALGTGVSEDSPASQTSNDDITDDEFEALLDELHGKGKSPGASVATSFSGAGDKISDDEFEKLLDELHGKGRAPGVSSETVTASSTPPVTPNAGQSENEIDDDEFEALLDQLHGKGRPPGAVNGEKTIPSSVVDNDVEAESSRSSAPEPQTASEPVAAKPAAAPRPVTAKRDTPVVTAETTVRVDTQRLDEIMNMVGELVLVRNRLVRLGDTTQNEALSKAVANLDIVTADLQTSVMKTRMQPIKKVFGRFPRVVRDMARNLKKEIDLELVGEETDLDKNLVEALADPLVHLVRNSVDHGIELPAVREANGKARTGKVTLSAEQEGDHILLSITDDGAGMDPQKLKTIAVEKGIYDKDSVQRLSDAEAFHLIFAPGFSTKKEISDVSGRGVGMDVVKTKISQLNGSIEIDSALGEGTRISIKVPLTLAIMPTLMVMLADQTFALPLVNVNEIFHMDLRKTHMVDGQLCVAIRDQAVPIFFLKNWLVKGQNESPKTMQEGHVVIVTIGTRRVGFVVDQLVGQEEVVIKPLGTMLHGTPGIAGATITGDGTIALILDIPSLLKYYSGSV